MGPKAKEKKGAVVGKSVSISQGLPMTQGSQEQSQEAQIRTEGRVCSDPQ